MRDWTPSPPDNVAQEMQELLSAASMLHKFLASEKDSGLKNFRKEFSNDINGQEKELRHLLKLSLAEAAGNNASLRLRRYPRETLVKLINTISDRLEALCEWHNAETEQSRTDIQSAISTIRRYNEARGKYTSTTRVAEKLDRLIAVMGLERVAEGPAHSELFVSRLEENRKTKNTKGGQHNIVV